VGHQLGVGALRRGALLGVLAAAGACAVPAVGSAAVTPTSRTGCHGGLTPDSSGASKGEPNLLDYSFHCNGGITAYSIIVNQWRDPSGSLDDFAASPSVFETDDLTPSPTESVTCEGIVPSDSINCNTGTLGAQISDGYFVAGTVDPVQPYCKHLPLTSKGQPQKPGFRAVPTAQVWLMVTDYTGAQDGPFALRPAKACPSVPNRVPPVTTTTTTTSHAATRGA
jgi:hypothetical protein